MDEDEFVARVMPLKAAPARLPDEHVPRTVAALMNMTGGNALLAAQNATILARATGELGFWADVQTELRLLFPWIVDTMAANDIPYLDPEAS